MKLGELCLAVRYCFLPLGKAVWSQVVSGHGQGGHLRGLRTEVSGPGGQETGTSEKLWPGTWAAQEGGQHRRPHSHQVQVGRAEAGCSHTGLADGTGAPGRKV